MTRLFTSSVPRLAGAAAFALLLPGCPLLGGEGGGISTPEPPTAELQTVNLTAKPRNRELAAYFCSDLVGGNILTDNACIAAFGRSPLRADLIFSFELVFDLGNSNDFPIPLVEILLALDVFEDQDAAQLGAVCVSFCDPEAEDCVQAGEDACRAPDKEVSSLEDFIPTVDDLIRIGVQAATGTLDDNLKFRYIPGVADDGTPGAIEARVRFDLGLTAILGILETVAVGSTDDLLAGRAPTFDIPYNVRGSVFFDVPVLGRHALSYGPIDGLWSLD